MPRPHHLSTAELQAPAGPLLDTPSDHGRVELIVGRPAEGVRVVLDHGVLDPVVGLVGDSWIELPWLRTAEGAPHPDARVSLMNARVNTLVAAGEEARRPWAGDELVVDLDLSVANLAVGSRLLVGDAVLELSGTPHPGCGKFVGWHGADATRFVNGRLGRAHRWRGAYARVLRGGCVAVGDVVRKEAPDPGV